MKVSDLAISDPDPSGNCRGSKYPDWRPAQVVCSQSFGIHILLMATRNPVFTHQLREVGS